MHNEPSSLSRRSFIGKSSAAATGLAFYGAAARYRAAELPSNRMRIAVMGLGRGLDLIHSSLAIPNTEVVYLCDVDDDRLARSLKAIEKKQASVPKTEKDIRRVIEDKSIDALFVAAPNHWHAPATIMACAAGKHVYVEKPCCHNPWEGEAMVAAARKNKRVVQMGNQRRSWPAVIESIEKLRAGAIGKVLYARAWYNADRVGIGHGKQVDVPARLNYDLWQGPAPERPYLDNLVHYNWHWRWHWGNGELGNNGIHGLDLVRWGLNVTYPKRVTCNGGRYHYQDDQETPDTAVAAYDFGESGASWDCSSCVPREQEKLPFVSFYGANGILENHGAGYKIFDLKGKLVEEQQGEGGEKGHIANFFDAIRTGARQHSEIAEGVISTLWCHLGNIAYRSQKELRINSENGHILDDLEAQKFWKRAYRPGWEPVV